MNLKIKEVKVHQQTNEQWVFYIYYLVEKIKLLDVDLVRIYSARSLFMTQFQAPQLSARKWSFGLSVNAWGSLIKPAPVVSREQESVISDAAQMFDP